MNTNEKNRLELYCECLPSTDFSWMKKHHITGVILPIERFSQGFLEYCPISKLDECIQTIHQNGLKGYLNFNAQYHQKELDELKDLLINHLRDWDGVYFHDLSIFEILKDQGKELVYHDDYLLTNPMEINAYLSLGMTRVGISSNITSNEVSTILKETNHTEVMVCGKTPIAVSKRPFLSIQNFSTEEALRIQDPESNQWMKVKQEDRGTIYFTNESVFTNRLIGQWKDMADSFLIGSTFLTNEEIQEKVLLVEDACDGVYHDEEEHLGFYGRQEQ